MRTPNLGSIAYAPGQPPGDPTALAAFLTTELRNIAGAIQLLAAGHLDVTHAAPVKPREGDIRLAAGGIAPDPVGWSPDSTGDRAVYAFYTVTGDPAPSWNKLG